MNLKAPFQTIKLAIKANNAHQMLPLAAKMGHRRLVKWILNQWPDLDGYSALIDAAKMGRLAVVRELHRHGVDIRQDYDLALRAAATAGHLAVVQFLHNQGCNITSMQNHAVRWAAGNGHLSVVQYLHEHGADIRANADNAVLWAILDQHLPVVQYLYRNGSRPADTNIADILKYVAMYGNIPLMQYLHTQGVDLTLRDNVCVRWAAQHGHLAMVQYLYAQGADLQHATTRHPAVAAYLQQKQWLRDNTTYLLRRAATVYTRHYHSGVWPGSETIPETVWQILTAAQA